MGMMAMLRWRKKFHKGSGLGVLFAIGRWSSKLAWPISSVH